MEDFYCFVRGRVELSMVIHWRVRRWQRHWPRFPHSAIQIHKVRYRFLRGEGVPGEQRFSDEARHAVSSRAAPRGPDKEWRSRRQRTKEKAEVFNFKRRCSDFFQGCPQKRNCSRLHTSGPVTRLGDTICLPKGLIANNCSVCGRNQNLVSKL